MRLIDADALKKCARVVFDKDLGRMRVVDVSDIDNAPTVEARPQGEWIERTDYNLDTYYDCSFCGNSWTTIEGTPWDNGMNFCPNCGAQMKGGVE